MKEVVSHYKNKAKEQFKKKVSELEDILHFIYGVSTGYDYETNAYRQNSLFENDPPNAKSYA